MKARIRHWLNKTVCFVLGHQMIDRMAVWGPARSFLGPEVEAVCLRCYKRDTFSASMTDNIFAESPFYARIKGRERQS